MEEQWYADRCLLRDMVRAHPDWTQQRLAQQTGRSVGWVKKWKRRLRAAAPGDDGALWGQSRARKRHPPPLDRAVVDRILAIRDQPPAGLARVPGPRAILYYLAQDTALACAGSRRHLWRRVAAQSDHAARR